jgi:hypothetical protein
MKSSSFSSSSSSLPLHRSKFEFEVPVSLPVVQDFEKGWDDLMRTTQGTRTFGEYLVGATRGRSFNIKINVPISASMQKGATPSKSQTKAIQATVQSIVGPNVHVMVGFQGIKPCKVVLTLTPFDSQRARASSGVAVAGGGLDDTDWMRTPTDSPMSSDGSWKQPPLNWQIALADSTPSSDEGWKQPPLDWMRTPTDSPMSSDESWQLALADSTPSSDESWKQPPSDWQLANAD